MKKIIVMSLALALYSLSTDTVQAVTPGAPCQVRTSAHVIEWSKIVYAPTQYLRSQCIAEGSAATRGMPWLSKYHRIWIKMQLGWELLGCAQNGQFFAC